MKHFKVFECPIVFKEYEFNSKGKRTKDKYSQQGIRDIFVGLPDDSAGWLFYFPDTKNFTSQDAVFEDDLTTPFCTPDPPFAGTIRLRDIKYRCQE